MITPMPNQASRVDDIDVAEVADGFVVYDPARDRVHFFNHTAAVVLELCDGTKSDAEIANLVQRCYELSDSPQAEVAECIAQLREEGLVA
ncbi:MAG: PqqD family protein [Actinobacteria bacterium]|nr:MAG: PqqD family protein [Actinomycetota bacterium]